MNTIVPNIIAMSERELLQVVGDECFGTLLVIDHNYLEYGLHRIYRHNTTIYTEAGLALIAEKLKVLGLEKEACCLATELNQRRKTPARMAFKLSNPAKRGHWWNKGAMA